MSKEQNGMIQWVQNRLEVTSLWTKEHSDKTLTFLNDPSMKSLFATVDHGTSQAGSGYGTEEYPKLIISINSPPTPSPGRIHVHYFIRSEGDILTSENIDEMLICGQTAMKQTAASVLEIMENEFYSDIFLSREWSQSSKQELSGLYHRFMASLRETANEERGKTILYLPFHGDENIDHKDLKKFHTDRDVVQQLEGVAIHWIRQIKGVLNSHEHNIGLDHQGPMEELRFWEMRYEDLVGITAQLRSKEVLQVLSILEDAKSKYVRPVKALAGTIQEGSKAAADSVKFLNLLRDPCNELSLLKPSEIQSIMPGFINCLRLIFLQSSNYNTHERIADLIRRVSSEIIRHCTGQIDLETIFRGSIDQAISILQDCINCGSHWKKLYNRTALTVNSKIIDQVSKPMNEEKSEKLCDVNGEMIWKVNDASIFAEMDAFVQRCDDLMDICNGRLQFVASLEKVCDQSSATYVPTFSWASGSEIENSLLAVRNGFIVQVDRLSDLNYCILNVRESQWHSDYNFYKVAIQDLDTMLINVMNRALEQIKVVHAAAYLLQVFRKLAHRPVIKHNTEKRYLDLRAMFQKQCNFIRREFDDCHRKPPLKINESSFAGSALWAKSRSSFIEKGLEEIRNSIGDASKFDDSLEVTCAEQIEALNAYQNQKYEDWLDRIETMNSNHLQERLDQPILKKLTGSRNQYFDAVISNFDTDIASIFTEAHFWDKLRNDTFVTPNQILGICHQREVLRVVRERVMMLVRAHNDFQEDLKGTSMLYLDYLKILEKKLRPGLVKIRWSIRPHVIDRFVHTAIGLIHQIHNQLKSFHLAIDRITLQCDKIASVKLVSFDRNIVYEGQKFTSEQLSQRTKGSNCIAESYEIIRDEVKAIYTQFEGGSDEVQREWAAQMVKIDNLVVTSMLRCVRSSLRLFAQIIDGQSNADSQPIFTIRASILNQTITYRNESLISITNSVNNISKETVGVTKSFKRLTIGKQVGAVDSVSSLFDLIASDEDVLNIIVRIMNSMSKCATDIHKRVSDWEQFKSLWNMDKGSYLRRYSKKSNLSSYHDDIRYFKEQELMIKATKSQIIFRFIQVDFSDLKCQLILASKGFQEGLLELLERKKKIVQRDHDNLQHQ